MPVVQQKKYITVMKLRGPGIEQKRDWGQEHINPFVYFSHQYSIEIKLRFLNMYN